jgi:hypothetical protein
MMDVRVGSSRLLRKRSDRLRRKVPGSPGAFSYAFSFLLKRGYNEALII